MAETTLTPVIGLERFSLRFGAVADARIAAALGLAFPPLNRLAARGERGAPGALVLLRLGPDEVQILVPAGEGAALAEAVAMACRDLGPTRDAAYSLVEISDRHLGYVLAGPEAAQRLNAGCPLDLSLAAFPVGMATRSLFHKTEIILWRMAEHVFRLEVWRSFAPYFEGMMAEAQAGLR